MKKENGTSHNSRNGKNHYIGGLTTKTERTYVMKKGYLQETVKASLLLVRLHPIKYGLLYLGCGIVGFWLAATTSEGKLFQSLPFYPVVTAVGLLTALSILWDIDIYKLRKLGLIPLITAILLHGTPQSTYAQSISPVIGDNPLEFYQNHLMIPVNTPQNLGLPTEPAGPVAVGVVVIVVGVIVYNLWEFCQRKFPKTPPPEDDPVSFGDTGEEDSYAMTATYSSYGSCSMDDLHNNIVSASSTTQAPLMVYELLGVVKVVNGYPEFRVSSLKKLPFVEPEDNLQDLAGFKADLVRHGVDFDDRAGVVRYGKNGQPARADQVPISFNFETRTVTISNGGNTHGIIIEKTEDLKEGVWKTMVKTRLPEGKEIKLVDVTVSPQTFYRIRPL